MGLIKKVYTVVVLLDGDNLKKTNRFFNKTFSCIESANEYISTLNTEYKLIESEI
jgi:hypothetical protein